MTVKDRVEKLGRHLLERTLDCVVLRKLPHGLDVNYDVRTRVRELSTIFDVGANIGQSALAFNEAWPTANIYSFEPFSSTFRELQANTNGTGQVRPIPCALGASAGTVRVVLQRGSVNNSLVNTAESSGAETGIESVQVRTLDEFCSSEGIDQIDFLKIDTEGYDLQVLQGANRMLSEGRISFIQVEAGMTPHNRKHVPMKVLQSQLEAHRYDIFGLYEQTPDWDGAARLRFCNAVFISERLAGLRPMDITMRAVRRG